MNLDPIRKAARTFPFSPFRINLVNGSSFVVKRWQSILVGPTEVVRLISSGQFETYEDQEIATFEPLQKSQVIEQIRQAYRREPFEPFCIKLTNGRVLNIRRRGHLIIGDNFLIRSSSRHDRTLHISEAEIESLQPITSSHSHE